MPPWFIDRTIGIQQYKNDASLTEAEIATIVQWADGGAREGNSADMPAAKTFPDSKGWNIGTPDLVVTQEEPFKMYAAGSDWRMRNQPQSTQRPQSPFDSSASSARSAVH